MSGIIGFLGFSSFLSIHESFGVVIDGIGISFCTATLAYGSPTVEAIDGVKRLVGRFMCIMLLVLIWMWEVVVSHHRISGRMAEARLSWTLGSDFLWVIARSRALMEKTENKIPAF
ncbi:hypothetical protein SLA2020_045160 [Shorea laevis]